MRSPVPVSRWIAAAILSAGMVALTTGCRAPVGQPTKGQAAAVRHRHRAIVLLRVIRTDNHLPEPVHPCVFTVTFWRLGYPAGATNVSPEGGPLALRTPSTAAREQGWNYLIAAPGIYCVRLVPGMTWMGNFVPEWTGATHFFVSIPSGHPLVYAGTFPFDRQTTDSTNRSGAHEQTVKFSAQAIRDETEAARNVANETLAGYGDLIPGLAIPYDDLRAFVGKESGARLAGIEAGPDAAAGKNSGTNCAVELVSDLPHSDMSGMPSMPGTGDWAGLVAAVGVAVLPSVLDVAEQGPMPHFSSKEVAAVNAVLREKVSGNHLAQRLAESVRTQLDGEVVKAPGSTGPGPAFRLRLWPYRVALRTGLRGRFALEVAVAVQLLDARTGTIVWENHYVHCHPYTAWLLAGFPETVLASSSAVHQLQEYEGEAGVRSLQTELDDAVKELTVEIAKRVQAAGLGAAGRN